jgi:hypothetical protein
MILRWLQLPLLLLVSLLFLHSTWTIFLLYGLYILKSFQRSWLHFYLLNLQCLLTDMFLLHYHKLCRLLLRFGSVRFHFLIP